MKQFFIDLAIKLYYFIGSKFFKLIIPFIIACVGITPNFVPLRTGSKNARSLSLTVMSYNVYVFGTGNNSRENRADRVTSTIKSVSPDVFGLQEADRDWMDTVTAALGDYTYVGVGRDDGEDAGEFSPVFYKKDKFNLLNSGTFWYSETPDSPSIGWGAVIKRICSWAVLEEKESGMRFAVFNSHFDNVSVLSRRKSAELLTKKIAEYAEGLPIAVTGDLNCNENEAAYAVLTSGGLSDSKYLAGFTDRVGTYHGYAGEDTSGKLPIDHIFVSEDYATAEEYRVITDKVDGFIPSDHYPIVSKITFYDTEVEEMIRVMSFNVLCGGTGAKDVKGRVASLVEAVNSVAADTIGFQEVTPVWLEVLKTALYDYDYVGVGRDDGKNAGEFSPVFYRKDKYNLIDSGTFWISETPDTPSFGWDAVCRRVCSWAVLENKETGEKFAHMNTHLDHIGKLAQTNGIDMIKAKAESFDIPVIITGDFNINQNNSLYRRMTGDSIGDTRYLAPNSQIRGTFHALTQDGLAETVSNPAGSTIDFIFVSRDSITPVNYAVVDSKFSGVYPSDHFPIRCDMYFN